MALRIVRAAALLLLGIYTGGVVFTVLAPSVAAIPGSAYVPYWQALNQDYGATMPVLVLSCVALLVATCVLSRRHGVRSWGSAALAALLVLISIGITVARLEPLNAVANSWSSTQLPPDWAGVREQWMNWHLVRTILVLGGFVALLAGQTLAREPERDGHSTTTAVAA